MPAPLAIRVDTKDDILVALTDIAPGTEIADTLVTTEEIPAKQKLAGRDFKPGDDITMYGVTVGSATRAIAAGELIHTGNITHKSSEYSGKKTDMPWDKPDPSPWHGRTFEGYQRDDGRVGTANHWIVVPLVFCESRNLDMLRTSLGKALGYSKADAYSSLANALANGYRQGTGIEELIQLHADTPTPAAERIFPNVDGLKFLDHALGCGGTRDDARTLCGLIAGYINHPNVAGATVLSLGCQNAQVKLLEEELQKRAPNFSKPLLIFEQQSYPSERDMLNRAITETFSGMAKANEMQRVAAPLSKLCAGMECGGSDGFSGISANPVIGHCADLLVAIGGSVILSEFPELCGVEQDLCDRCETDALATRFANLMKSYNARAEAHGSGFRENPSPGNIRDGLVTDAIKSAGAAKKGGGSPVVDVLDYPEPLSRQGLSLLCTPGSDVESTTAMAGSGANILLFSTGLGTPTGNPVAPTLKISSNAELSTRLPDMIDFDTGAIIRGEKSIDELGSRLLDLIIETASGRFVPNAVQLGQDDFLPWKRGVSL
ncbi:MAG: altronate dehydratase [Verrucomicrobiaceae bacterium]|nr:altronate dehydratase [Verrucomicrobiaceae bacterium]